MSGTAPLAAQEVAELLVALVRNRCVNDGTPSSGQEVRSVETLDAYLGVRGVRFERVPGRTSVLYRVPGRSPTGRRTMLMAHLDVVPANPDRWSVDPFAGEIREGVVWGRGAVDMLNLTSAMAAVFRRYLDGTLPPLTGDLLFLAAADEEAGGELGAAFLTEEHWPEVGADYLLTEIAYPAVSSPQGPVYLVNVAEKGPHWTRLATRGTSGHASQPHGTDNALLPLARAFARLGEATAPIVISDEWRAFVAGLGLPSTEAAELVDPERVDEAVERLAAESPGLARYVHACTHLTISPTVLRGGVKANVIPDDAEAEVDVRTLPGQNRSTVDDLLRKVFAADADRITLEPTMDHPANASPTAGALWEAIVAGLRKLTGSTRIVPAITPATTDARFFRTRGTEAYGVGWFDDRFAFPDFLDMFHGDDERVSVESLGMTSRLLMVVLEELDRRMDGTGA